MVRTGRVRGRELIENRDGSHKVLMLQVEITNARDMQTVQYVSLTGDDSNPPDDSIVYMLDLGPAFKIAFAADDLIEPSMGPGEKKIYSSDAGAVQAFINLLTTGIIELNGNADFVVRFTALEAQMQILVTAINAAFATKLNGSGSAGGLVLDLSTAKVDEVKVP